jgi:hypothetical protein
MSCLLTLACSCNIATSGIDGSVDRDADSFPDGPVQDALSAPCMNSATFTEVKAQVLPFCGGEACHLRAPFAGGNDLTDAAAYADLVNHPAQIAPTKVRVKPGDPANSFLWQKLNNLQGASEGFPMPRGLEGNWAKLSNSLLTLVQCWIAEGAKND